MKLYYCSTDAGGFDLLLTTDEDRAVQLFSIHVVLSKVQATRMTVRELTSDAEVGEHLEGLRDMLSKEMEAFLTYELDKGWVSHPVVARFDALSAGQDVSR
jgi:hypothetical protein